MNMRRILAVALGMAIAGVSQGNGEIMDAFMTHYKIAEESKISEQSCALCHVSDEDFDFNAYGQALAGWHEANPDATVGTAALDAVAQDDSDGDGASNADEIQADAAPGNPAIGGTGAAPPPQPVAEKKKPAFPPKNGFHPALVHFPIALFIAGLLLDLVGLIRKDKTMLLAGWYNIVLAALSAFGGIATGLLAMSLMKLPFRGLLYDHMLYAIGSTVAMWVMVAMRVHRHEEMRIGMRLVYYVLAVGCFLSISWAGHLGGVFVYGE